MTDTGEAVSSDIDIDCQDSPTTHTDTDECTWQHNESDWGPTPTLDIETIRIMDGKHITQHEPAPLPQRNCYKEQNTTKGITYKHTRNTSPPGTVNTRRNEQHHGRTVPGIKVA